MYVMKVDHYSTLGAEKIIWYASETSNISKAVLRALWEALGQAITSWVLEGHIVEVLGLGNIRAEVRAKAQSDAADVSADDIINEFVEELIERISKARKDFIEKKQDANIDVYVSSSYKDNVIAEEICKNLAEKGFRVNTNHSSIISSEDYFNEMKQSIQNASFFVPILTKSIEEEHIEPHLYRIEWKQAIEVSRLYGRQFIIPVVEQGLDIFSLSIPKEFAQQNYVSYRDEADLEHVVTFITSRMPQIE